MCWAIESCLLEGDALVAPYIEHCEQLHTVAMHSSLLYYAGIGLTLQCCLLDLRLLKETAVSANLGLAQDERIFNRPGVAGAVLQTPS